MQIKPTCGNRAQREHPILVVENLTDIKILIKDLVKETVSGGIIGIDTETSGIDPRRESPVGRGRIVCWSLATSRARYFLWAKHLSKLKHILESESHPKVGHNVFTFDRHMFANHGIELNGIVGDTMRMARFLRADKRFSVGLKSLMEKLFGYKIGDYKDLFSRPSFTGKINTRAKLGKSTRTINEVRIPTVLGTESWNISWAKRELIPLEEIETSYRSRLETLYDYATLDAKATRELYYELLRRLKIRDVPKPI